MSLLSSFPPSTPPMLNFSGYNVVTCLIYPRKHLSVVTVIVQMFIFMVIISYDWLLPTKYITHIINNL